MKTGPAAIRLAAGRPLPRGGAYVLMLGAAAMLTVIGLGAIAASRAGIKAGSAASDAGEAASLAGGAIEAGLARMNKDDSWRRTLSSGKYEDLGTVGRGTIGFRVVDELDDDLEGGNDPVRLYGIARVGAATRTFSIQAAPTPPALLEVLKYTLWAGGAMTTAGTLTLGGSGLRCGATVTNSATIAGDVSAVSVTSTGAILGLVTEGALPPGNTGVTAISFASGGATDISYDSISRGTLEKCVISELANPYGAVDPRGAYRISVPLGKSLVIRDCRVRAGLWVSLGLGATLRVSEVNWEAPAGLPALVVTSLTTGSVTFDPTAATLSESGLRVNLNPVSLPYAGASDTDTLDTYPVQIRGIVHIASSLLSTSFKGVATIRGALLCEGAVDTGGTPTVSLDTDVLANAPAAYVVGEAGVAAVRGTWRWEVE